MAKFEVKRAIMLWSVITSILWASYLALRLTVGGDCPTIDWDLQENFDRDRYLGRWHEMFRHYDVPYEIGDCATATYSNLPLNQFKIENVEYLLDE